MIQCTPTCFCWHLSPVGNLLLVGNDDALNHIVFPRGQGKKLNVDPQWEETSRPFKEVIRQLDSYFQGQLTEFDIPLAPSGTAFQQQVWDALQKIPYGETCSYAAIARDIDKPSATRAVGNANGRNPIPIMIPCHRVIGRDGSLTGFGGGLPTKNYLLQLEDKEQLSFPF